MNLKIKDVCFKIDRRHTKLSKFLGEQENYFLHTTNKNMSVKRQSTIKQQKKTKQQRYMRFLMYVIPEQLRFTYIRHSSLFRNFVFNQNAKQMCDPEYSNFKALQIVGRCPKNRSTRDKIDHKCYNVKSVREPIYKKQIQAHMQVIPGRSNFWPKISSHESKFINLPCQQVFDAGLSVKDFMKAPLKKNH